MTLLIWIKYLAPMVRYVRTLGEVLHNSGSICCRLVQASNTIITWALSWFSHIIQLKNRTWLHEFYKCVGLRNVSNSSVLSAVGFSMSSLVIISWWNMFPMCVHIGYFFLLLSCQRSSFVHVTYVQYVGCVVSASLLGCYQHRIADIGMHRTHLPWTRKQCFQHDVQCFLLCQLQHMFTVCCAVLWCFLRYGRENFTSYLMVHLFLCLGCGYFIVHSRERIVKGSVAIWNHAN